MTIKRTLVFAIRSKRLACLIFSEGDLKDWHCSYRGAKSQKTAREKLKYWLKKYHPDMVIFEHAKSAKRKGTRQHLILEELYKLVQNKQIKYRRVERHKVHRNQYDEAARLGERFPILKDHVPQKPPIWEAEASSLIFFEALALALPIIDESA